MQIVNYQYNTIDVKLWDYLERDTKAIIPADTSLDYHWKPDYRYIYHYCYHADISLWHIPSKLLATARVMDVDCDGNTKQSHIVYHHEVMISNLYGAIAKT